MIRLALLIAASLTFAAIPSSVSAGCSEPDCTETVKKYGPCTRYKTVNGDCSKGCDVNVHWDCPDKVTEKAINAYCKKKGTNRPTWIHPVIVLKPIDC